MEYAATVVDTHCHMAVSCIYHCRAVYDHRSAGLMYNAGTKAAAADTTSNRTGADNLKFAACYGNIRFSIIFIRVSGQYFAVGIKNDIVIFICIG